MTRTNFNRSIFRVALMAALLCGLAPWGTVAQQLTITDVSREGNQTVLTWEGGEAPYQVQRSSNLSEWENVASPTDSFSMNLSGGETLQFFRVLSSDSGSNLGEYIGQLRVAEGEFGVPMARHRLKSIWDFYAPEGMPLERTAAGFFESAIVRLEILEEGGRTVYTAPFNEFPDAVVTSTERSIHVAWSTGIESAKRDYSLSIDFRYNLTQRRTAIHLSDPTYKFSCRYVEPQLEIERSGEAGSTLEDEVELVEIADNSNAPAWWQRKLAVTKGDISVDSLFEIGVPNIEGGPAFIFKTPLLTHWQRTRITGITEEPIELTSRFSQSYFPFHHNFVETLYLEPALEPAISETILAELRAQNIWLIVPTQPTAFPESESTLQFIGFDGVIRELP